MFVYLLLDDLVTDTMDEDNMMEEDNTSELPCTLAIEDSEQEQLNKIEQVQGFICPFFHFYINVSSSKG